MASAVSESTESGRKIKCANCSTLVGGSDHVSFLNDISDGPSVAGGTYIEFIGDLFGLWRALGDVADNCQTEDDIPALCIDCSTILKDFHSAKQKFESRMTSSSTLGQMLSAGSGLIVSTENVSERYESCPTDVEKEEEQSHNLSICNDVFESEDEDESDNVTTHDDMFEFHWEEPRYLPIPEDDPEMQEESTDLVLEKCDLLDEFSSIKVEDNVSGLFSTIQSGQEVTEGRRLVQVINDFEYPIDVFVEVDEIKKNISGSWDEEDVCLPEQNSCNFASLGEGCGVVNSTKSGPKASCAKVYANKSRGLSSSTLTGRRYNIRHLLPCSQGYKFRIDRRVNVKNHNNKTPSMYERFEDSMIMTEKGKRKKGKKVNKATRPIFNSYTRIPGLGKFPCTLCSEEFNFNALSLAHSVVDHPCSSAVDGYVCPTPTCSFKSIYALEFAKHMFEHTGEKRFKCKTKMCHHETVDEVEMRRHCTLHFEKRPVRKPTYFNAGFKGKETKAHNEAKTLTPTDESIPCQVCGTMFRNMESYAGHLDTHIVPFVCPVCGEALADNQELLGHMVDCY